MDYEKKYKEALEKAKEYYKDCKQRGNLWFVEDMEDMFPELKESEDNRIRKWIIGILSTYEHDRDLRNAAIAYLEKQGEQKHTAEEVLIKAGLKPYKDGNQWCILLGDNIQEGICGFGDTIDDALYAFLNDLIKSQKEQKPTDNIIPIFKTGDVIKNNKNGDTVTIEQIDGKYQRYCYKGWDGAATIHSDFRISEQDDWELVEQKPAENSSKNSEESDVVVEESSEYKNGFECGKQYVLKYPEEFNLCKKSAWSEEDESMLFNVIWHLRDSVNKGDQSSPAGKLEPWIRTLKDRVLPQPKQEWSEEDKEMIEALNTYVKQLDVMFSEIKIGDRDISSKEFREKVQSWLKSLKERYTWKPSDEQMYILNWVADILLNHDSVVEMEASKKLQSLYNDLKKLKGE